MSHIEVRDTQIQHSLQVESTQLGSEPPPELYHVPHGKTIYAKYHSKGGHGAIRRKYIHDESLR